MSEIKAKHERFVSIHVFGYTSDHFKGRMVENFSGFCQGPRENCPTFPLTVGKENVIASTTLF